jgi:ParB/RepB/Spo0J family partition protein
MRRFYPDAQAREMADSIRAVSGVIQPLIITPDGEKGSHDAHLYYVVDGNLRLAGARLLVDDCPDLMCRVVHATEAEQMLMMVTTTVRYDVDPISEAMHYRALLREGYEIEQIAQATGRAAWVISSRLRLLELDEDIQRHIAAGRLPRDHRVVTALNSIRDREARLRLANKFAEDGVSIRAIEATCKKAADSLNPGVTRRRGRPKTADEQSTATPMLSEAQHRAKLRIPDSDKTAGWQAVREVARATCSVCDVKLNDLHGRCPEPAWALITHSAGQVCESCNLADVAGACNQCPAVDLLKRLIEVSHG